MRAPVAATAEMLLDLLEQEARAQDFGFEEKCAVAARFAALVANAYPGIEGAVFSEALQRQVAQQIVALAGERREAAARRQGWGA